MNSNSSPQDSRKPVGKNWCGRYELLGEIGRGGMGIVYRAIHPDTGQFVAIKQLVLENIAPEKRTEFKDRFKREAYTIARLKHPNIVDVIDICIEDDSFFYVMEFLDGDSLRKDLLRRGGKMSVEQLYPILSQVGEALSLAHSMSIVHRDVKPDNIILDQFGKTRLLDFGLAKLEQTPSMTINSQIMGTPYYMSPEQIKGEEVGPPTDIYAWGVMFYQMVTGLLPFSKGDILYHHVNSLPISPKSLTMDIPESLDKVILKSMEKEVSNRYQTFKEAILDLEAISL